MSFTQVEPLEDVQCGPSEGPVDESLQLKHERDRHETLKGNVVDYVVTEHEPVTLFHFCHSKPYLQRTCPEIAAVQYVEHDQSPIASKLIASNITR